MKTLKKSIVTCMILIALIFVGAQKVNAQFGEFGLRYMPTFSNFDMQTSDGNTVSGNVTIGHGAGVLLGYHFNEYVGIQGEIIYNNYSRKYVEMDVERKINLRYVNIPLLLSINTGKHRFFNLNIVAGPQIGINVGSKVVISGDGTLTTTPLLKVKKGDFGFAYGAGIDFGLNESRSFRLGMGFRGVYGLVDISNDSNTNLTNEYYILERTNIETYSGYVGFSVLF